jgi:hypothetical protein
MRASHADNNPSGVGSRIVAAGDRVDDDERTRSMGGQGQAHRLGWSADKMTGGTASHDQEFSVESLSEKC